MKTKHILTTLFRLLLGISFALLLNACGPGTGGTGTGPVTVIATVPAPSSTTPTTSQGLPLPSAIDNRLALQGLWNSESKQGQAYFDAQYIVFRKGCLYYEYVGGWNAKVEPNSDQTVTVTAEGYTWNARLSNGKLSMNVTISNGPLLLEDNSLVQAPFPQSKPTPSSVCEG
jgi:hypothetical protein